METIIIKLDAGKLDNPDLDIIYQLPEKVEEITDGKVYDNGYDYLTNQVLAVWLAADCAAERYLNIIELMRNETFSENDLSKSAEVYISEKENAELDECKKVYPVIGEKEK